jgi:hypothetical protein
MDDLRRAKGTKKCAAFIAMLEKKIAPLQSSAVRSIAIKPEHRRAVYWTKVLPIPWSEAMGIQSGLKNDRE